MPSHSLLTAATLSAVGGFVDEPDDACGRDPRRGNVLTGFDASQGLALLLARHREDRERRLVDRGERERESGVRVDVVARGQHQALARVAGGGGGGTGWREGRG